MATSIRLSPETEQRLDFLAAHTGHTKAFYLREIIESCLDKRERDPLPNQGVTETISPPHPLPASVFWPGFPP